jgi:hypothetical protein
LGLEAEPFFHSVAIVGYMLIAMAAEWSLRCEQKFNAVQHNSTTTERSRKFNALLENDDDSAASTVMPDLRYAVSHSAADTRRMRKLGEEW